MTRHVPGFVYDPIRDRYFPEGTPLAQNVPPSPPRAPRLESQLFFRLIRSSRKGLYAPASLRTRFCGAVHAAWRPIVYDRSSCNANDHQREMLVPNSSTVLRMTATHSGICMVVAAPQSIRWVHYDGTTPSGLRRGVDLRGASYPVDVDVGESLLCGVTGPFLITGTKLSVDWEMHSPTDDTAILTAARLNERDGRVFTVGPRLYVCQLQSPSHWRSIGRASLRQTAIDNDHALVATGTSSGQLLGWDMRVAQERNHRPCFDCQLARTAIKQVQFLGDGATVMASTVDSHLCMIDIRATPRIVAHTTPRHDTSAYVGGQFCVSPDSTAVLIREGVSDLVSYSLVPDDGMAALGHAVHVETNRDGAWGAPFLVPALPSDLLRSALEQEDAFLTPHYCFPAHDGVARFTDLLGAIASARTQQNMTLGWQFGCLTDDTLNIFGIGHARDIRHFFRDPTPERLTYCCV